VTVPRPILLAKEARRLAVAAAFGLAVALSSPLLGGEPSLSPRVPGHRLALQLHSVRADLERDLPGTLAAIRRAGVRRVEFSSTFGRTPRAFRAELDRAGLRAVAAHFPLDDFTNRPGHILEVARATGARDVGVSWIARPGRLASDASDVARAAAALNSACRTLRPAGLRVHYHVHGYEFADGGALFDNLLARLDPACVDVELDTFWVAYAGADPAALLHRHGRRIALLHLKDIAPGAGAGRRPLDLQADNAALGTGRLDLPAILRAARAAGVRWYIIEDETSDGLERLAGAVGHLNGEGRGR